MDRLPPTQQGCVGMRKEGRQAQGVSKSAGKGSRMRREGGDSSGLTDPARGASERERGARAGEAASGHGEIVGTGT